MKEALFTQNSILSSSAVNHFNAIRDVDPEKLQIYTVILLCKQYRIFRLRISFFIPQFFITIWNPDYQILQNIYLFTVCHTHGKSSFPWCCLYFVHSQSDAPKIPWYRFCKDTRISTMESPLPGFTTNKMTSIFRFRAAIFLLSAQAYGVYLSK